MKYSVQKLTSDAFGNVVLDWAIFGAGLVAMAVVLVATVVTL